MLWCHHRCASVWRQAAQHEEAQSDGARNWPTRFAENPPLQGRVLVLRPTERDALARCQGLKSARERRNLRKLIRRTARSGRACVARVYSSATFVEAEPRKPLFPFGMQSVARFLLIHMH